MNKTDIEIKISKRLILGVIGVIAFIGLLFFILQVYDDINKKALYHKMYSALKESKELQTINRLINTVDSSELDFMKDAAYTHAGQWDNSFLGQKNKVIFDSVTYYFNVMMKSYNDIFDQCEILIPYGYLCIRIVNNNYPQTIYVYKYSESADNMLLAYRENSNITEDAERERFCEGKELNAIVKLNNPKFEVYITGNKYWR